MPSERGEALEDTVDLTARLLAKPGRFGLPRLTRTGEIANARARSFTGEAAEGQAVRLASP